MSIGSNSIKSLLNIKDDNIVFYDNCHIKKRINYVETHVFHAKLSYIPDVCPHCATPNSSNSIVKNGFRLSKVRLLPISNFPAILLLKKQRFICRECNRSFMASSPFIDSYCNLSNDLKRAIFLDLTRISSIKDIADKWLVAQSTVLRILENVPALNRDFSSLPEYICMDEFKSVGSVDFNMSFIFMDAISRRVIDILPDRRFFKLVRYFQRFPIEARRRVKGVIIDMYNPYISLIKSVFPNACIVFDRFHVVQNLTRALDRTRIAVMNSLNRDSREYKVLKRYWKLFLMNGYDLDSSNFYKFTHFHKLMSQASIVQFMKDIDPVLSESYECVQQIMTAVRLSKPDLLSKSLDKFLRNRLVSDRVKIALNTTKKYEEFVCNALSYEFSNGPLEGFINKIKLIKRVSYGYRNFFNLKRRIILCSYNFQYIEKDPGGAS